MKVKINTVDQIARKVLSTETHLQVGGLPQITELVAKALRSYPQTQKRVVVTVWQDKEESGKVTP